MTDLMKISDVDRKKWVQHDRGLSQYWRTTRLPLGKYVKANRRLIDEVIQDVTSGRKVIHYLANE